MASIAPSSSRTLDNDSDEESFVILDQSLPPESLINITEAKVVSIDPALVKESLEIAASASMLITDNEKLPSLPTVEQYQKVSSSIQHTPDSSCSLGSNVSDLSPNEIQAKIENLIVDNHKLKGKYIFRCKIISV